MGACSSKSAHGEPAAQHYSDGTATNDHHVLSKTMGSQAVLAAGEGGELGGDTEAGVFPDEHVVRQGSQLMLAGRPFRFSSLNAPELFDASANGRFEHRDTMLTFKLGFACPTTRTYTLSVKSRNIGRGHINSWRPDWHFWEFDGPMLVEMDHVLAEAARLGVKVIIPFVNQDFGGEDTDWVGNITDLVRMRKGLSSYEEAQKVDFWRDQEMIESYKLIVDFILGRTNTINGRKYSEDPTILCWETGNELAEHGHRAAPASWTLMAAKHIKARAPKALVMDGSFAKTSERASCFPKEVLESPDVDIISYHYYGSGDIARAKEDCKLALSHDKVFVAGEFGFFDKPSDYERFLAILDKAGAAGALVWSLRPHSLKGGFKTHGEGNGIYSYHVPGWRDATHPEFDRREEEIVRYIREASFKMNGLKTPPYPTPPGSSLFMDQQTQTWPPRVSWTGAAWAKSYELIKLGPDGHEELSVRQVKDDTKENELWLQLLEDECAVEDGCDAVKVAIRPVGVDGHRGPLSNALEFRVK